MMGILGFPAIEQTPATSPNPTPLRFAPCGDDARGAQSGTGGYAAQDRWAAL